MKRTAVKRLQVGHSFTCSLVAFPEIVLSGDKTVSGIVVMFFDHEKGNQKPIQNKEELKKALKKCNCICMNKKELEAVFSRLENNYQFTPESVEDYFYDIVCVEGVESQVH